MNWTKCFQTQNCAVIHKVLHKGGYLVHGYLVIPICTLELQASEDDILVK